MGLPTFANIFLSLLLVEVLFSICHPCVSSRLIPLGVSNLIPLGLLFVGPPLYLLDDTYDSEV